MRYSHIIAADVAAADAIGEIFGYSAYVQPLQVDLLHLIQRSPAEHSPEALTQHAVSQLLSNHVAAIYHIAGYVDTRENPAIRRRLFDVNSGVTSALAALASRCGVARFVHVSSASVLHSKLPAADSHIPWYFRLLPRPSMLSQKYNVSVPTSSFSSYSASKLEGEQMLLQVTSSSGGGGMLACIIRPHVIWGAHDPLSTEMLLSWPRTLPLVLIGDIDSRVVAVRVDSVAQYAYHPACHVMCLRQCLKLSLIHRYILMADAALFNDGSLSRQIFNVGDESVPLGDLHACIVMLGREMKRRQSARSLLLLLQQQQQQEKGQQQQEQQQQHTEPPLRVVSKSRHIPFSFGCLRRVDCSSSPPSPSSPKIESFWVIIIPKCILFVMLLLMEVIDLCFGRSRFVGHIWFISTFLRLQHFANSVPQSAIQCQ